MYCPECRAEFRPGFIRCSDCDVDLVEELPEGESSSGKTRMLLWECADQAKRVGVCRELQKTNIHYKVDQIPCERTANMRVVWHYRILSSPGDLNQAKGLLDIEAPQHRIPTSAAGDEEVPDPAVELPDGGTPLIREPNRCDTCLEDWYPEDATAEVWSQDVDDLSATIQLCLDANYIHCRCDSDK